MERPLSNIVTQLPVGFRPTRTCVLTAKGSIEGYTNGDPEVAVYGLKLESNGTMTVDYYTGSLVPHPSGVYLIDLDGIFFDTE